MRTLDLLALALLLIDGSRCGIAVVVVAFNDIFMLWKHDEDRQNRAARIMYMSGCLQQGAVRILTAFMFSMTRWLLWPAIGTYAVEAILLFMLCSLTDLMYTWRTVAAAVANLMAMGVLIGAAVTIG